MIAHAIKRWLQALYVLVKKNLNYCVCVCACVGVCVHYAVAQFFICIPALIRTRFSFPLTKISACSLNLSKMNKAVYINAVFKWFVMLMLRVQQT